MLSARAGRHMQKNDRIPFSRLQALAGPVLSFSIGSAGR